MKNIKIAALIVIVIIAGFASWSYNYQKPRSNEKFVLSVNTWVGFGPFWLAKEKGFFDEQGINVDIQTMEDTGQRKIALVKGDIDGLGDTVDLLVLERDEDVPAVAVMQIDASVGADGILATENIKDVVSLKSQKIAVQKNFVSEAFLNYVLQKNGLTSTDVQIIDTEAGAAGAAFVSGAVNVAVTFEPWLSKAKERNGGHVLVSSADYPGVVVDILSINEEYLKNHPEIVQKVMRGWFKAIAYWKSNPQEANAIMANHYNVTPADFVDIISGLNWPTYEENLAYFGTQSKQGKIYKIANTFVDIFLKTGQIKAQPDMIRAIDQSLLQSLYE